MDVITKKETKFARIIRIWMISIMIIYPFGSVIVAILPGVTDQAWNTGRIPAFLIAGTVIGSTFLMRAVVSDKMAKWKTVLFCLFLFLIALSLRLFLILILQTEPVSDFYTCYEYAATGNADTQFLARYTYLGAYALTLRMFFKIFGISVWNAQLFSACITSLIPVILYITVCHITGKPKTGAAAGFLYAVCLPMAIYTAVPSCEHFSQFFLALAVFAYAFYCTADQRSKRRWILCIVTGVLVGCVCIYKSIYIVLAPALLATGILYECVPLFRIMKIKNITAAILQNIILVMAALLVAKCAAFGIQKKLVGDETVPKVPYAAYVYDGLCIKGNGIWNQEVQQFINHVLEECKDEKEANRIFYENLIQEYKNHPIDLWNVLKNKFFISWCSEDYYHWTFSGNTNLIQGSWMGEILFIIVPRIFFMLMNVVMIAGMITAILSTEESQKIQFLFFIVGVLFLFTFMLAIIEAQARYKSSIMPLLCILFGMGTDTFYAAKLGRHKLE